MVGRAGAENARFDKLSCGPTAGRKDQRTDKAYFRLTCAQPKKKVRNLKLRGKKGKVRGRSEEKTRPDA